MTQMLRLNTPSDPANYDEWSEYRAKLMQLVEELQNAVAYAGVKLNEAARLERSRKEAEK